MEYVEDTGLVVSVSEDKATVQLDHKSKEDCGSCCACSAHGGGPPSLDVPRGDLKEGDRVSVRIPRVNTYLSMALVFGLPLVLFLAGMAIGRQLEGDEPVGNMAALGGILGIIVAFLIAWLVNRAIMQRAAPEARRIGTEGSH